LDYRKRARRTFAGMMLVVTHRQQRPRPDVALRVLSDYASAYDWYAGLLGRQADMFPHDSEAVWRLTGSGALYVVQDPNRAGSGLLTLAVTDLDTQERRLREAGVKIAELVSEDPPRRVAVTDPDGNTLTFFEDPAKPAT
jgi:glyoxylase I family protein